MYFLVLPGTSTEYFELQGIYPIDILARRAYIYCMMVKFDFGALARGSRSLQQVCLSVQGLFWSDRSEARARVIIIVHSNRPGGLLSIGFTG